jgi:acetyl esterase/lipase
MLVQAGTGDPLLDDARLLVNRARSHAVDARLELYPVNTHNIPLFWSFLPEAAEAMRRAGDRVDAARTARFSPHDQSSAS